LLSLLVTVGALLLHLGFQGAVISLRPKLWAGEWSLALSLFVAVCLSVPLSLGLVWMFLRWRGFDPRASLGLVGFRWTRGLGWVVAMGGILAVYEVARHLAGRPPVPDFLAILLEGAGWPELLLLIVAAGVVVPFYEEVLVRGFLLPGLQASILGGPGAVVVSSVLWAGLHLQYDLFDLTAVFALGILFGCARLFEGSTLLAVALHALVNTAGIVEAAWLAS
jgi:membrane protease YdiL (CAAX protease family)